MTTETTGPTHVTVIGGTGMLGSMLLDVLSRSNGIAVCATARSLGAAERLRGQLPRVAWCSLDVETTNDAELREVVSGADYVINAAGLIKQRMGGETPAAVESAIRVNSLFPMRLAAAAEHVGAHVLQIATDCVYSGARGAYLENDPHDPHDVYGKTKSLGEVRATSVTHLRCSIIGPEPASGLSLLEWFLRQPRDAAVRGFTNHLWNGVTTLHFAKLCGGIMRAGLRPGGLRHVVPADVLSKDALLRLFAAAFGRGDIDITPVQCPIVVDRTLSTADPEGNRALWAAAGFDVVPTLAAMVGELARFDYRLAGTARSRS